MIASANWSISHPGLLTKKKYQRENAENAENTAPNTPHSTPNGAAAAQASQLSVTLQCNYRRVTSAGL
jgi:hypothetical protein